MDNNRYLGEIYLYLKDKLSENRNFFLQNKRSHEKHMILHLTKCINSQIDFDVDLLIKISKIYPIVASYFKYNHLDRMIYHLKFIGEQKTFKIYNITYNVDNLVKIIKAGLISLNYEQKLRLISISNLFNYKDFDDNFINIFLISDNYIFKKKEHNIYDHYNHNNEKIYQYGLAYSMLIFDIIKLDETFPNYLINFIQQEKDKIFDIKTQEYEHDLILRYLVTYITYFNDFPDFYKYYKIGNQTYQGLMFTSYFTRPESFPQIYLSFFQKLKKELIRKIALNIFLTYYFIEKKIPSSNVFIETIYGKIFIKKYYIKMMLIQYRIDKKTRYLIEKSGLVLSVVVIPRISLDSESISETAKRLREQFPERVRKVRVL
jgi:hypothetical protein